MYMRVCVYVCIYIYIYIHMFAFFHTHTHTHKQTCLLFFTQHTHTQRLNTRITIDWATSLAAATPFQIQIRAVHNVLWPPHQRSS
jgi:hypothetical protein